MSEDRSVLVIDDEAGIRDLVTRLFTDAGFKADSAPDGIVALEKIHQDNYDLVILDLSLPKMNGLEILNEIKQYNPEIQVIMATAYGSTKTAIEALRLGAYDYISKPFELDELQLIAERALEQRRIIDENKFLREELKKQYGFDNIIGSNPDVQKAYVMAAQVAKSNASVLILGETGTGKEYLARTIHYQSDRADGPFIKVNCAALPENLLESELFGHEKGAFTNAVAKHIGRFEAAHGGTIFLDEIGEISPLVQTKLLRVLQEKQFERVGGSETITVDVRVIAATNRNLQKAIEEKKFREDLYYRLNVLVLRLPPIRERGDDIDIFANHFLRIYSKETGKRIKGFTADSLAELHNHSWPGNIRELENAVERGVILCNGEWIKPEHLMLNCDIHSSGSKSANTQSVDSVLPITLSLRDIEKFHIERVLKSKNWNQSATAQLLSAAA
ncbi:MAG: sigma-54 dependent transcriptional regulator, partial [Armatimonadota bacterium]